MMAARINPAWRTNSILPVLSLALAATPVAAKGMSAEALCFDARVRKSAAKSVGLWAEQFPFAKTLIGTDARFGDVGPPRAVEKVGGSIICHTSFNLVRVAPTGRAYAVAIADFAFRVTATGDDGYTIAPANLPDTVAGAAETMALIDRFTVDGRPYRDTIADNLVRLQQRERR